MRVIVCGRAIGMRIYEADGWRVDEGDFLNIVQGGTVIATHSPGSWETVTLSEVTA